jgi:flavin reductase (DIM6/NTAB) family NADH-FMN oxidoreductase RutF
VPSFALAALAPPERARLLTRVIAPRPIAVVSSLDADGRGNLAPFSFFTAGGHTPPTCCFVPVRDRHGHAKHTLRNITATGEYVINVATRALADRINQASFEYPDGVDEFDAAGFTRVPSIAVRPPRVAESPVHLECRLLTALPTGDGPGAGTYVIGEILHIHAADAVCTDGLPDNAKLAQLARLGADFYLGVDPAQLFALPRPTGP